MGCNSSKQRELLDDSTSNVPYHTRTCGGGESKAARKAVKTARRAEKEARKAEKTAQRAEEKARKLRAKAPSPVLDADAPPWANLGHVIYVADKHIPGGGYLQDRDGRWLEQPPVPTYEQTES